MKCSPTGTTHGKNERKKEDTKEWKEERTEEKKKWSEERIGKKEGKLKK